tara:strand:- start:76 stop:1068 length:993 start_codon:yes stop_codon:yes gene_type:complete
MLKLQTKGGFTCNVPETEEEDLTPKFSINKDDNALVDFYKKNGFVVIKKIFKEEDCKKLINYWNKEVKSFNGKIYRREGAKLEKNIFNKNNWVMNSVLNIQSLNPKQFPLLRNGFTKYIVSNQNLANLISKLIQDKPMIVQSMYFEGNSVTHEHQDSYYLDDQSIGSMVACWIALENIKADSGRFFVCPKSHLYDYSAMTLENNIVENHNIYKRNISQIIKEKKYEIIAPKLNVGDILLWNSLTIHGSLDSQNEVFSRSSITFHAVRSNSKFLVMRSSLRSLEAETNLPFCLYRPKDQTKMISRIILNFESKFPESFYKFKKFLIKRFVK